MASMNHKRRRTRPDANTTVNHEGSTVHKLNPLEELFSKVLGSFFGESTFYESRTPQEDFKHIEKLISEIPYEDIEYVLKIAKIGREYNMIQYPLALLTACFNDDRFKGSMFLDESTGKNKLQTYSDSIIRRGKDILDVMSMQMSVYGFDSLPNKSRNRPLPTQMRKSLKHKLETFSEYQLSKALGNTREVSMADCIKLLRPNPNHSQVSPDFYKRVIEGDVKFGNGVKQVQSELANSRNSTSKSGTKDLFKSISTSTLTALLKNLVALVNAGVLSDLRIVDEICRRFADVDGVRKSHILPFRFYSAYTELADMKHMCKNGTEEYCLEKILIYLSKALDSSIESLPDIKGHNLVVIDRSGSMDSKISKKSKVTASTMSLLLGAILYKKGNADVCLFASKCFKIDFSHTRYSVIDLMNKMMNYTNIGYSTNLNEVCRCLTRDFTNHGISYDNMIILTDGDCYADSKTIRYDAVADIDRIINRGIVNTLYIDNLLGNDFVIANTNSYRKNLITGFSEKIVDIINLYSQMGKGSSDIKTIIDTIEGNLPKRT